MVGFGDLPYEIRKKIYLYNMTMAERISRFKNIWRQPVFVCQRHCPIVYKNHVYRYGYTWNAVVFDKSDKPVHRFYQRLRFDSELYRVSGRRRFVPEVHCIHNQTSLYLSGTAKFWYFRKAYVHKFRYCNHIQGSQTLKPGVPLVKHLCTVCKR